MTPIAIVCSDEERKKISIAREKKKQKQKKDIDYESKEYHGSYADDDREEVNNES